jgi:hypothetical protein
VIHPPGDVAEPTPEWSDRVSGLIEGAVESALEGAEPEGQPAPFYNPLEEQLDASEVQVKWPALSGTLRSLDHLTTEQRWEVADRARTTPAELTPGVPLTGPGGEPLFGQDEYCEWSVTRDASGDIMRVTFTSEVREWYQHLAADPAGLLELYQDLTGEDVQEAEIFSGDDYIWDNDWNTRTDGPIVHLAQQSNNLEAAISLAAEASVLRIRGGSPVTDARLLMQCQGLGAADRFSDPSIATTINGAAATGARISLANPPGLYLAGIRTEGMRLPAGHGDLTPRDLWVPERGEQGRVVRARFGAPNSAFPLSQILLDGRPIVTGAQLAERVDVLITALVHPAGQEPTSKPCLS